jgi:hypothetical protein
MKIDTYRRNIKVKTLAFLFVSQLRRINTKILIRQEPYDEKNKKFHYLNIYSGGFNDDVGSYYRSMIGTRKYEELKKYGGWNWQ